MKLSQYSSYVLPVRPFSMCAYFTNEEFITHTYSLRFVTPFDIIHLMHLIRVWLIGVCFNICQTKHVLHFVHFDDVLSNGQTCCFFYSGY